MEDAKALVANNAKALVANMKGKFQLQRKK